MPTREIFWNIGQYGYILYFLLIPLAILLAWGIYKRYRLWRLGRPDNRVDNLGQRVWSFIKIGILDGFIHRRFFREPYPGIMHFLIFIGCLVFLLGAAVDFITHYGVSAAVGSDVVHGLWGAPYLGLSLAVDVFGILVIIGVIIAAYRRYIQRPSRLDNRPENAIALSLIVVIVLTGFVIEGVRIAYFTANPLVFQEIYPAFGPYNPAWALWSPGGWVVAQMFGGVSSGALLATHSGLWWFHTVLALGAIVYVALTFSSLAHIVVAPFNVFFKTSRPKGALAPLDLEEAETYGVGKVEDFTWKQLLDLDSCTRCGRCQDNCPAYLSGKALSPKKVIQDLKRHWLEVGPGLITTKAHAEGGGTPGDNGTAMVGDVVTAEELWDCTTCRACMEACPVYIEHIDKIVDMRRYLVLEQAEMPETAEGTLRCIEDRGHSCRGTTVGRGEWCLPVDVTILSEDSEVDVLYFVGCAAALEERNMKVAVCVAELLKAAGLKVGLLCDEETCCGDPSRRLGNEYLFQMQAQKNIETFNKYGVKKIVTSCPHCYNTIKNEYPQFGSSYEVVHHSELLAELLKQGKLKLDKGLGHTVTYHDACYLGRHNDIYDDPRAIVKGIPQAKLVEMERCRNRAFCCGGGGGHFWIEEKGERISEMRIDQAMATKADIVATACPYCLQMFEDAIKAKGATESFKSMDVAELMAQALKEP